MSDRGADLPALLDAWRRQGADRLDPLRFQRIEALARRAAGQHGAVRGLLDARLADLAGRYADAVAAAPARDARAGDAATARPPAAIGPLLVHLAHHAATHGVAGDDAAPPVRTDRLDDVRRACAEARSRSRVRQALGQPPENAGPLNSASLVHRALTLMRDASPEYLASFMAYADTLAALEHMPIRDVRADKAAPPSTGGRRSRGGTRGRRG